MLVVVLVLDGLDFKDLDLAEEADVAFEIFRGGVVGSADLDEGGQIDSEGGSFVSAFDLADVMRLEVDVLHGWAGSGVK